jgi:hypothetical protein
MANKVLYADVGDHGWGTFCLSDFAARELPDDVERHDPRLISVVERIGLRKASGQPGVLQIKVIKGDRYRIKEYHGFEEVVTPETDKGWIVIKKGKK